MNNKIFYKKGILKQSPYLLLCTLIFYPLLPNGLQSVFLITFFLISLFSYKKNFNNNLNKIGLKPFFLIVGWFVILGFTLLYSENFDLGFKRLIRGIHIVFFPLLFLYFIPSLPHKKFSVISNIFIFVHLFLVFFLLFKCFEGIDKVGFRGEDGQWIYNVSNQGFLELVKEFSKMSFARSRYFINENEITTFFIHKAYLSIGLAWCFFLSIHKVYNTGALRRKLINFILAIFFLFSIIYFTSIPNLLALLVLFPLYVYLKVKTLRKKIIVVFTVFVGAFLTFQIKTVQDKVFQDGRLLTDVYESKNLVFSIFKGEELDNTNVRYNVWKCSFNSIKDNFWIGIGLGDEESVLKRCYKKNCNYCLVNDLNTHNNYGSLLLSGGIVVLLLFLFSLFYQIIIGFRARNILHIIFILLFAINLMSENMLSRINGILFYSIFSGIMMSLSLNKLERLNIATK